MMGLANGRALFFSHAVSWLYWSVEHICSELALQAAGLDSPSNILKSRSSARTSQQPTMRKACSSGSAMPKLVGARMLHREMSRMAEYNWLEIRMQYINGQCNEKGQRVYPSLADLSKQTGISLSTLAHVDKLASDAAVAMQQVIVESLEQAETKQERQALTTKYSKVLPDLLNTAHNAIGVEFKVGELEELHTQARKREEAA
jgi:hypothetical protein